MLEDGKWRISRIPATKTGAVALWEAHAKRVRPAAVLVSPWSSIASVVHAHRGLASFRTPFGTHDAHPCLISRIAIFGLLFFRYAYFAFIGEYRRSANGGRIWDQGETGK
jgi:hypothetical protein